MIKRDDDSLEYEHDGKANLFWYGFKDRLVKSKGQQMMFPLEELFQKATDLFMLDAPFTNDEIDQVVKNLPSDKSLGPDGFNTNFLKKCCPILNHDFYDLCHQFYRGVSPLTVLIHVSLLLSPRILMP